MKTIEVGTILTSTSWNYVSFFVVTKKTPCRVTVKKLKNKRVSPLRDCGPGVIAEVMPNGIETDEWRKATIVASIKESTSEWSKGEKYVWSAKERLYLSVWDGKAITSQI